MKVAIKLDHIYSKAQEFSLKEDEGIFIFSCSVGRTFYLLQENSSIDGLPELDVAKEVRYVGSQKVLDLILNRNGVLKGLLSKTKIIDSLTPMFFDPETQKLKFKKINGNVNTKKKKVLIIDDSSTIQKLLSKIINSSELLEVHAIASSPSEAKEILKTFKPDIITLDIHMPEMDGVTFYKTYLKQFNIPVACISSISINEGPLVLEALSSGVLTYIQKPDFKNLSEVTGEIVRQLEAVLQMKKSKKPLLESTETLESGLFEYTDGLIAIGSSTGGTQALEALLMGLPSEIPPIVIVQHIPEVFSKALASRLNTKCDFVVKEVEDKDVIRKNTVFIARGGMQFKLKYQEDELIADVNDDDAVNSFKPSVDYLFNSIEGLEVSNGIGVILTGMGKDGAAGLLRLKEKGFHTIAQDESSSVVYGMPRAAFEIGATKEVVKLSNMATAIVCAYNRYHK